MGNYRSMNMKKKRRIFNFLKKFVIFIVTLMIIVYGAVFLGHKVFFPMPYTSHPTISPLKGSGFNLDAASHKQPTSMKEYLPVLASQVKNYNLHLNNYWPNNPEKNQYVIAKQLNDKQAYLIAPNGKITKLNEKEFKSYNIHTLNTDGQWSQFKKNGISGAYITVSPDGLNNYYVFQKYYHLGTYDQFLSYSHELFHSITQNDWNSENKFGNIERNEHLEDISARRTRMLLQQELSSAISDKRNREDYIKKAVSTYINYKEKNKQDYINSGLYDRLEGTAFYYEIISGLYAGYPKQIHNNTDAYNALQVIFSDDNPAYRVTGSASEGYRIGGYSAILLDMLALQHKEDPNQWKLELEKDGNRTPMDMLADMYKDQELPRPTKIPTKKQYQKWIKESETIIPKITMVQRFFQLTYSILF